MTGLGGFDGGMGSHQPQGVGWWQAADGRYYPPHLHPNYRSVLEAARLAEEQDVEARRSTRAVSRLDPGEKFKMLRVGIVGFVLLGGCGALYSAVAASKMPEFSGTHGFNRWVSESFRDALRPVKTAHYRRVHLGLVVEAESPVEPDVGEVTRSDDFSDTTEGWLREDKKSGDTYGYVPGGYAIHSAESGANWAFDPNPHGTPQGSVSVVASLSKDSSKRAARGAVCSQGSGQFWTSFGLAVAANGQWQLIKIEQFGEEDESVVLESGFSAAGLGRSPIAIQLVCSFLAEEGVTRIVGFVAGNQVVDVQSKDRWIEEEWVFGLLGMGPEGTSTFTSFEVRDLTDGE